MGFFLGVLLLMWAGIAATFVLPGFQEINHFKSMDLRGRLRRDGGSDTIETHHVHAEPHAEIRTARREAVAPPTREGDVNARIVREVTPVTATKSEPAGMVFDAWSNQWVNFDGDVVSPDASSSIPMNSRAEAYRRVRPDTEVAVTRRPTAPSPNRPVSPARKAALRRRMVLKYMVIAIAVTTIPAVLTSWGIFVASATLAWLSFVTWFAISVRQFFAGEITRSSTTVAPAVFDDLPDNVIALRRPPVRPARDIVDEFFDPSSAGGFARAKFAVGE